jgi:hypothetical protein
MMQMEKEKDRKLVEWDWEADEGEDMRTSEKPVLTTESRARPNFTYKLKIIVSFLQVGTNLAYVVEIPWPSYYMDFMNVFNVSLELPTYNLNSIDGLAF